MGRKLHPALWCSGKLSWSSSFWGQSQSFPSNTLPKSTNSVKKDTDTCIGIMINCEPLLKSQLQYMLLDEMCVCYCGNQTCGCLCKCMCVWWCHGSEGPCWPWLFRAPILSSSPSLGSPACGWLSGSWFGLVCLYEFRHAQWHWVCPSRQLAYR